jgi:cardiolipin synthase
MQIEVPGANCKWFCTGNEVFPAMVEAIAAAQESVCLETYIFSTGPLGERFRDALVEARRRGVAVRVLIDAFGSYSLSSSFWRPLILAGGEVRRFNPLALNRLGIRDHRKLLVCDERVAFVGGFNIAPQYNGDGVTSGWRDLGLRIEGPLARELGEAFEEMFERADFQRRPLAGLRRPRTKRVVVGRRERLLLSGPGVGLNPIKRWLREDLKRAHSVQIMVGYFLPTWRLRRQLIRIARGGGRVQLLLAGKSDVWLSQLAARSLYRRFLRAGVEIYEYQPQVLHAKLFIVDDVVYAGSANLDQRSLNLNYEIMVRLEERALVEQAREIFEQTRQHCQQVTFGLWHKTRTVWSRVKQQTAYWLLVKLDPYLARRQWRGLL